MSTKNQSLLNLYDYKLDRLKPIITWHDRNDFGVDTASGYSFRLGNFCILMIQNHAEAIFKGLIKFPFKFTTRMEACVVVIDNDAEVDESAFDNKGIGWTRDYDGKGVTISNFTGGHMILVVGILE